MAELYKTPWQIAVEWINIIVGALIIMFVLRIFLLQPFIIPSESMLTTLQPGDRIFVTKFSYGIHLPFMKKEVVSLGEPERGDIVVFPFPEDPSKDYIKRVIGIPGDVLEIRNKRLYRNGKPVQEDYIMHIDPRILPSKRDGMAATAVPAGKVFVMGDNRDNSEDSRYWGFVDKDTIYGKAVLIYWSSLDFVNISWDRIGKRLR